MPLFSSSSFDQAFSIGTSCVFLSGGIREMRAAPLLRVELLSRKTFAEGRVDRAVSESAKKTGGRKAGMDGTR